MLSFCPLSAITATLSTGSIWCLLLRRNATFSALSLPLSPVHQRTKWRPGYHLNIVCKFYSSSLPGIPPWTVGMLPVHSYGRRKYKSICRGPTVLWMLSSTCSLVTWNLGGMPSPGPAGTSMHSPSGKSRIGYPEPCALAGNPGLFCCSCPYSQTFLWMQTIGEE